MTQVVKSFVDKELFDLKFAHIERMAFLLKKYIAFDPINLGLFGANTVVLSPNDRADLIEQFGFSGVRELLGYLQF